MALILPTNGTNFQSYCYQNLDENPKHFHAGKGRSREQASHSEAALLFLCILKYHRLWKTEAKLGSHKFNALFYILF